MRRPEQALQIALVAQLRALLPAPWLVVHVRNQGEQRSARMHGVFKAMGVVAGFPDLLIFGPGGAVVALEVKAPPRRLKSGETSKAQPGLSLAQLETHARLGQCGVPVAVVRSVEDALEALGPHCPRLRGRAA